MQKVDSRSELCTVMSGQCLAPELTGMSMRTVRAGKLLSRGTVK